MKNAKWIVLGIAALIVLMVLSGCFFTVAEDEYACTVRFSKIISTTADGNYEASIIRNNVDKKVNIIVSDANAEAAKLVAEGEAEYMRLLGEAYDSQDKKDFYEFTLALDALKQSLTGKEKTIILDGNSELAKILAGAAE